MKLALISCGRSDYSIYFPLLSKLNEDPFFVLEIIAFGTHVSSFHGRTVDYFKRDGFTVNYELESLVLGDSAEAISSSMGLTTIKFAGIWAKGNYDMIVVLGDRFEMFAAISASVPFNIPVAHLHGGETTLGAIDDKFRHCITSMSSLHFTTNEIHAERVASILGHSEKVFNVGAPALDNLNNIHLLSIQEFKQKFSVDLSVPTILTTFHPETVNLEQNLGFTSELIATLKALNQYQIIITMPNADTMGTLIRNELEKLIAEKDNCFGFEMLGVQGYYSCVEHCSMLLGNTSSGIIEAASFGKYVINIGDRQKGRSAGKNVIHVPIEKPKILQAVNQVENSPVLNKDNIYGNGTASEKIIRELKSFGR